MRRRALGTAVAVAVVLAAGVVWSRRDADGGAGRRPVELASRPFPEGQLLVPGDIGRLDLMGRALTEPGPAAAGRGSIVVTRVEEGVAAVIAASAPELRGNGDLRLDPVPGEAVGGAPVVDWVGYEALPGLDYAINRSRLTWMPTDQNVVSAMSIDLSQDELREVAEQVVLDPAGALEVPGEVIGEIPATWDRPQPGVTAAYEGRGQEFNISVASATPQVQAAYVALAPEGAVAERTHGSCCLPTVVMPPRELRIEGRTATIATISWSHRIVVVEGNPGAVLVAAFALPDDDLIAIVKTLTPTPPEEFRPLVPQ